MAVTPPTNITRAQIASLAAIALRDPANLADSASEDAEGSVFEIGAYEPGLVYLEATASDGVRETVIIDEAGYVIDADDEDAEPKRPY